MSSRPVGKCVNFRQCPKADNREDIPVTARESNPACPNCGQPLLISTSIVNPRRNALVAAGIVVVLLLIGLGFTLEHSLKHGSNAPVAAPAATSSSAVAVATVSAPTAAPSNVKAAVAAAPKPVKTAGQVAGNHAGNLATPAPTPGQRRPTTIPSDAASAYAKLTHTAERVDDVAFYFRRDSGLLNKQGDADIARLVSLLKTDRYRDRKVLVAGFADNSGAPNYSEFLSGERAQAVAAALTAQGVAVAQTFSFGQIAPLGDNATREGREKNRRVEIFVAR
jgi:outer membrane protein OmpA-like peptidoglycan-associated protein